MSKNIAVSDYATDLAQYNYRRYIQGNRVYIRGNYNCTLTQSVEKTLFKIDKNYAPSANYVTSVNAFVSAENNGMCPLIIDTNGNVKITSHLLGTVKANIYIDVSYEIA